MPLNCSQSVGSMLHELKHSGKKRPAKQRVAIALAQKRRCQNKRKK